MTTFANFPLFCIVASLMCSVISSVLPAKAARRLSLGLTAGVCLLNAAIVWALGVYGGPVYYIMGHFPHPWGNELVIGLPESLMATVFSLVLFLCLLGGASFLETDIAPEKQNTYFIMVDLVQASLLALSYTNDLFTGYVFLEICTLASCGLIMIRQTGRSILAAVRYMIFALVGSGLFLLGVVLLYNITGHLLMPDLSQAVAALAQSHRYRVPLSSAICLITVGLAIKSGLCPFHYWMADTYGCSTPCSSGILSGLVSKGYIFFLLKVIFGVFGTEVFYGSGVQNVLFVFGICGMMAGSVAAIRENDIFRMLADSSAAQIGYVFLGIGISPTAGVTAALFHMLTHAITKPVLFLSAARLSQAAGGRKTFSDLTGGGYVCPVAGFAFSWGALSMIGIPMTMGFLSKYLLGTAALATGSRAVLSLLALAVSTVLNTFYFARTMIRLYTPSAGKLENSIRAPWPFGLSVACFTAINAAAGLFAWPLISLLEQGLETFGKVV